MNIFEILLKKAKISDYNPQISRILAFLIGMIQMNHPQTSQFLNETIIENIIFIHIKIISVEQHLQLRESETLELNQQVFLKFNFYFLSFF